MIQNDVAVPQLAREAVCTPLASSTGEGTLRIPADRCANEGLLPTSDVFSGTIAGKSGSSDAKKSVWSITAE